MRTPGSRSSSQGGGGSRSTRPPATAPAAWRQALVRSELPRLPAPRRMRQLAKRHRPDLTDPLTGQTELAPDLLERPLTSVIEAEAEPDHPLLPAIEAVEDAFHLLPELLTRGSVERRDGVRVLDQRTELRVAVVADRRLERDRHPTPALRLFDAFRCDRPARILRKLVRDFDGRWLAPELDRELASRPRHALHRLDHVHRHADRPRLVRDRPLECLSDPPGGVGRELEAALPFELVDSTHESGVAFLDEVQEAQPAAHELLCVGDDESQVGRDHVIPSRLRLLDE